MMSRKWASLFQSKARLICYNKFGLVTPKYLSNASSEISKPALHGIRVLDISRVLAGPFCTMNLGDLGAEIIKIERPGIGDETRTWHPPKLKDESCYFLSINRNKKSVAVDLKNREGQELIKKLAQESDVLVENYLPGKLSEMGLGYEEMKKEAPHLVYCSITGYGQTGPYHERAGYDVISAGMGGLMHITGPEDGGPPCRVGVAMTDMTTGLYASSAIMAALISRGRTGKGQHIDCNLLSTQVAIISHIGSNYLNAGQEAKRYGNAHASIVPYQAFETSDSYIIIGAGNNSLFEKTCKIMDLEFLLDDVRFKENSDRVANRQDLLKVMKKRFLEQTTAEWLEAFEGSKIPYGPINNMQQVFSDPQVLHNGLVQSMDHPTCGEIRVPGPAVRYSDTKTVLERPPPILGQHTQEVLQSILGYDAAKVQDLAQRGVVELGQIP